MKIKTNNILEIYNTFYDENLKKKKKSLNKTNIIKRIAKFDLGKSN